MDTIRIRLVYFAVCREALGRTDDPVELPRGASVADVLDWLTEHRAPLRRYLPTVRVAVNQEFASPDHALDDGDELVLVPPVSGGSGRRVGLVHTPIARDAALELVDHTGAGAVITFAGVVRPTSKDGRDVTDLFYEAYEPMALNKLQECLDEAHRDHPILDAAVVHRLGALDLGEVAVSIVVCGRHRAEAFAACSGIIDRLKEIVPIWKKETGPDGSEWVSEGA